MAWLPAICHLPAPVHALDCVFHLSSVQLLQLADDTTLEGRVRNSIKSEYRREMDRMVSRYEENNIQLNASETSEIIVDFDWITTQKQPQR